VIGRNHKLVHGKSHLSSVEPSESVAKVTRWHHEINLNVVKSVPACSRVLLPAKVRVEVVHDLCHDARPVDAVDGGEMVLGSKFLRMRE